MKKLFFFLSAFLILSSCKKESTDLSGGTNTSNAVAAAGKLYEYSIYPSTTNPAITTFNNQHYVCLDTRVTAKGKLFVFLPGTTGFPSAYKLIVKKASALGYHSVGLMYPNNSDLYVASGTNPDSTQFGKCRQEIFDGTDQTTGVSVNSDNCIKNRLYKLLVYLQTTYPTQNWSQYISNGTVAWNKVVIAGHSQGGGHAFYIAKKVAVDKAISFASIDWNTYYSRSAPWVYQTGATAISKFYSINSTKDEIFAYANVQTQLNNMGIQGSAVSIDNSTSPYSSTRRLITSATPALLLVVPNHNLTCLDTYVPKTSTGAVAPAFDNAWTYLINN